MMTNRIVIEGDIAKLYLKDRRNKQKGIYAILDKENVNLVRDYSWTFHKKGLRTNLKGGGQVFLHRLIAKKLQEEGMTQVDTKIIVFHKNKNILDNREINFNYLTIKYAKRKKTRRRKTTTRGEKKEL